MRWSASVVFGANLVLAASVFATDASAFFGGRTARACAAAVKERCGHAQPRGALSRHVSRRIWIIFQELAPAG